MKKLMSLLAVAAIFAFSAHAQETNPTMQQNQESDVVDIAVQTDYLSSWMQAIQASGMAEELKEDGPYTIFAPTNDAFQTLPTGTFDDLMESENREILKNLVKAHIVKGEYSADDISNGKTKEMMNGEELKVSQVGDQFMLNGSTVITPDLEASNGVIHIIDGLMVDRVEVQKEIERNPLR